MTLQIVSSVLSMPIAVMERSSDCSDAFDSSTFANVWA